MDPRQVLKKSGIRALTSSGNLIVGMGSLLLAVATVNPLPLILYAVGSVVWVYQAVSSGRYTRAVLEEEQTRRRRRLQDEQRALAEQVKAVLEQPSFQRWVRNGDIPDYQARYESLLTLRNHIVQLAHDRPEVVQDIETSIGQQLDHMMTAYLQLVKSHATYLMVLARENGAEEPARRPRGVKDLREKEHPLPALDSRLSDLQQRIDSLRELADQQPGTRAVRQTHVTLLEKQIALLRECHESDQRVIAQLDTFVDAFELISNRMSAAEVVPNGITDLLGEVVQQVDETMQFAEALRPQMDQMLGELSLIQSTQ